METGYVWNEEEQRYDRKLKEKHTAYAALRYWTEKAALPPPPSVFGKYHAFEAQDYGRLYRCVHCGVMVTDAQLHRAHNASVFGECKGQEKAPF